MEIVIDTSAVLAVLLNERHKSRLIAATAGNDLMSPCSLEWEIGNALSAMFKRKALALPQATKVYEIFQSLPIRRLEVDMLKVLKIADETNMYAYDAYMLFVAKKYKKALLTLDRKLADAARTQNIALVEY